ncbi:hypothetical protein AMECASPLE_005857 [Ameca splendens]|uniref:Uncharacterized protein n=1 Tax=Ameca splendens TaxID=208324 RepID=A0ABV0YXT5_9TELE
MLLNIFDMSNKNICGIMISCSCTYYIGLPTTAMADIAGVVLQKLFSSLWILHQYLLFLIRNTSSVHTNSSFLTSAFVVAAMLFFFLQHFHAHVQCEILSVAVLPRHSQAYQISSL